MSERHRPKLKSLNLLTLLSRLSLGGMRAQYEHGHVRYQRRLIVYVQAIRADDWQRAVKLGYVEPASGNLWKLSALGKDVLLNTVNASESVREYARRAREVMGD